MPKGTVVAASPGVISRGEVYQLPEFLRRVGWGRNAMRSARRAGLRVIRTNGRVYVAADDAIAYLRSRADLN